jgi:hypothetical protein
VTTRIYTARFEVDVEFAVPEEAITRVLENHDENGISVPPSSRGCGWRDTFYDLSTEEAVVGMLGMNLGVKGLPLKSLDGWADIVDPKYGGRIVGQELISFERKVIPGGAA